MFTETAELYDLIYDQFRDYAADVERVAALIRDQAPHTRSILDVGCGTGRHAQGLAREHGLRLDGLDIEPRFVKMAAQRVPEGRFVTGDMADFDLGRRYDLILCLFSSIGYVKTRERLEGAARCFSRHLAPGGLAVVEPWFTPDSFTPGRVYLTCAETEDVKISRMSTSSVRDGLSVLDFQYLVGTADGVRHLRETHELGLFTREEMQAGLEAGGLEVEEYDPEGLTGRGLFLLRGGVAG